MPYVTIHLMLAYLFLYNIIQSLYIPCIWVAMALSFCDATLATLCVRKGRM